MPVGKISTYEELLAVIKESDRDFDMDLIERAYKLASELHANQKRLSNEPYIIHPLSVAAILVDLGMDSESIAAGLLHDVVEDTPITLEPVSYTHLDVYKRQDNDCAVGNYVRQRFRGWAQF